MSKLTPLLTLCQSCEEVINWTTQRLQLHGFNVKRTFDLQAARSAQTSCTCPHHGTKNCACQMVVLIISRKSQLATIVVHGQDASTSLSLVESASQSIDEKVFQALHPAIGAMKGIE